MRKYRIKIAGDGILSYKSKAERLKAMRTMKARGIKIRPLLKFRHSKVRTTPRGIYHVEGRRKMGEVTESGFLVTPKILKNMKSRGERFEAMRSKGEITGQESGWLN